jgi:2-phosphosulfolactate phosphatase
MPKTVVIDCFPESAIRYRSGYAVVAVDVARATTTAISVAAAGRRCFPVSTLAAAFELASRLEGALLAGEQNGLVPPGFKLDNSPTELIGLPDIERPVILLSSSGTRLCCEAAKSDAALLACFRNYASVARHLAEDFSKVAVIGAGSRGTFREEDQMCCAWIAELLLGHGYEPYDAQTLDLVLRWSKKPVDAWIDNESAAYLRSTGQQADLDFILNHVADLDWSFTMKDGEVIVGR